MFGAIFATYIVLRNGTYGGPSGADLFHLMHAFGETLLLLTAALFAGLARVEVFRNKHYRAIAQYCIAFLFGVAFVYMTYSESASILAKGFSWQTSAFLSAFFTVIWMHAFHVIAALIWTGVIVLQLFAHGITANTFRRLSCLTLFWQFLSILWVFTFTIVYLMGIARMSITPP
jgi:cytochrome o ubiquinol oxidase subunit 3